MKTDIGIVIVNYNVRNFLAQCLDSIRRSRLDGLSTEVWVVDNASIDGSVALLKEKYPEIRIIENSENVGFSKANNQAIRQLQSKYTLLLNPDTVLEEDTLLKCYHFMESHQECGAVGVRMIDGSGRFLPESKRAIPDLWNSFCKLSYLSSLFPGSKWFSGYNLGYIPEMSTARVEVLCGAFMFIRSEVWQKTGVLDERFFMYGEDIDLSYRILKAGYEIYYYPESTIIHYKGESTKKSSLQYVRTFYGAMITYVKKHYSKGNARIFAFFVSMAILVRAFMSALSRLIARGFRYLLDLVIIYLLFHFLKDWWSVYYHHDADYYPAKITQLTFLILSFIWVISASFFGKYDRNASARPVMTGYIFTVLIVLVFYGLAPEQWRVSRLLVFGGSLLTVLYHIISSFLYNKLSKALSYDGLKTNRNIAVVAKREAAEKILNTMKRAEVPFDNIYFINPSPGMHDSFYVNDVSALKKMVRPLQISEVIFSSESMSLKEIIAAMGGLGEEVSIKIGGDDSLNIIGSNSRNYAGEYYSIDFTYNLNKSVNKRFKRTLDIGYTFILLLTYPLLALFISRPGKFFKALISVLKGEKTWVGYGGNKEDFDFLPALPMGLIPYPDTIGTFRYVPEFYKKANLDYARHYTVLKDIELISKFTIPFTMISKDYELK